KLAALETSSLAAAAATEAEAPDEVIESTVIKYLEENAAELAAEKDKPFQPIGMTHDEEGGGAVGEQGTSVTASASADAALGKPAPAAAGKPAAAAAVHAK